MANGAKVGWTGGALKFWRKWLEANCLWRAGGKSLARKKLGSLARGEREGGFVGHRTHWAGTLTPGPSPIEGEGKRRVTLGGKADVL